MTKKDSAILAERIDSAVAKKLNLLEEFSSESDLTEEDALQLGREVSEKAMKRHKR